MTAETHTPLALFRLEASPRIGGGHAARCMALARALEALGWTCAFAARAETLATIPALARWRFVRLDASACDGAAAEAAAVSAVVGACDLLVVDHYGLEAAFETACRRFSGRILAFEDVPGRVHDCDLLLDPAPDRTAADYAAKVPAGCRLLLGPAYAPLRPEFAARRLRPARGGGVGRVLVNVGATDPDNVTGLVLAGLEASALPASATVDVALTSAAPHLASVRRTAAASRLTVTVHVDPPSMADLMIAADLAIGAGGSGSWERCCLGLPTILLLIADNQRPNAVALVARGAALTIDPPLAAEAVADAVSSLAADPALLLRMGAAARLLCDGRGAARVAALIRPPAARDGRPVSLRPAELGDADALLAWRQEPAARIFARNPQAPTAQEHMQWLRRKLDDPGCLLSIVEHGGIPAGMVRLDRIDGAAGDPFEISINVAPGHRRLGIGLAALTLARRLVPEATLRAYVMAGNAASRSLFAAAGFLATGQADWYAAPPLSRPVWREDSPRPQSVGAL